VGICLVDLSPFSLYALAYFFAVRSPDIYIAEHHVLYQYNVANAADHYIGLAQTETVSLDILLRSHRS
jgi:hypothetical protein